MSGERTLRYSDVAAFTYAATRHFVNGSYTGTQFNLRFDPAPGSGTRSIVYNATLPHADQELDNLRDQIAAMIAVRMKQQLAKGHSVAWTPNLCFLTDGLEYAPAGVFGRKDPIVVPYSDIASYHLEKGVFYVHVPGRKKAAIQEAVASANFFPGFFLFLSMFKDQKQGSKGG